MWTVNQVHDGGCDGEEDDDDGDDRRQPDADGATDGAAAILGLRAVGGAGGAVELGFGGREGRRVGGRINVVVGIGIGFTGGVRVDSVRHGRSRGRGEETIRKVREEGSEY